MQLTFDYDDWQKCSGFYAKRVHDATGSQLGVLRVHTLGDELLVVFREASDDRNDESWKTKQPTVVKREMGIAVPLIRSSFESLVNEAIQELTQKVEVIKNA